MNPGGGSAQPRVAHAGMTTRPPLSILFVDPDVQRSEPLAESLRAKCVVAIVPGVAQALHAISYRMPDLIVTELVFPDASGVDFITRIRSGAATKDVLIMVLTAHSAVGNKIAALQAGADSFIVAPVGLEAFSGHVQRLSRFRRLLQ